MSYTCAFFKYGPYIPSKQTVAFIFSFSVWSMHHLWSKTGRCPTLVCLWPEQKTTLVWWQVCISSTNQHDLNSLKVLKVIPTKELNVICSGSHKGTGIKPLRWKVSKEQRLFQICACKYTKDPPFCDATHTNLPCQVLQRQEVCPRQQDSHNSNSKLCTGCGWVPDFWLLYTSYSFLWYYFINVIICHACQTI